MSFLVFPSYEIISSVDAWANMKANANAIWRDLINNGPRDSFRRRASCDFRACKIVNAGKIFRVPL